MRPTRLFAPTFAVLACLGAAPATAQVGSGPGSSMDQMRQWSHDLAYAYLQGWSSGNAQALADVRALYGPRVNFYGQTIGQRNLFDQKRRFGERWPVRRYQHRPGTMRITCEGRTQACLIRSVIDWVAANPERRAVSRGSSTFELGIAFSGPKPVVLFEKGHVIRTAREES